MSQLFELPESLYVCHFFANKGKANRFSFVGFGLKRIKQG